LNKQETLKHSYEFNTSLSEIEFMTKWDYYNVINYDQVKNWLRDAVRNNHHLRKTSRYLYNLNGIYTNVIDYMISLPTLDRVVYSLNQKHSRFKKNKEKYLLALRKIKDKLIVRDILRKLAIDGTSFYYFEVAESADFPKYLSDTEIDIISELNAEFNCSIIPLPTDYCKIVGRKNSSYVIAFDMSYFDQFLSKGLSLKLKRYPKEIRNHYRTYRKDKTRRWAVLDNEKTICVKVRANIEEQWGRPIGLAAFIDMMYDLYFVDTKRHILDEVNSTIIYQTFPEGAEKGTSSLTQTQQRQQHDNIKHALFTSSQRKGVNFFSVAAGTKLNKIETDVEFLKVKGEEELIRRISTNLGFAGSALNGENGNYSSQQTNMEMVSAEIFSWIEQIQEEFNKVINLNIIKDPNVYVEIYYLPITHVNRKHMVNNMKDLYTSGRGSLSAWIASTGWNVDAYLSLMEYELDEDWENKYPVHKTSYTLSKNDNSTGRPVDNDSTNENTIKSKSAGGNKNPRVN
jgi:hypothetical protein